VGEIKLVAKEKDDTSVVQVVAEPVGVEMDRVASAMRAIEDIATGRLPPDTAMKTIVEISRSPLRSRSKLTQTALPQGACASRIENAS
jgi:uncharacterized membrane protein YjjP (DUF1212 family)